MIYSKLPIVFLSTIASEKKGSTNSIIATYILEHLDELQDIGIQELAEKCHVANSSISRFCKDIGLRDFMELKELLASSDLHFEEQSSSSNISEIMSDYSQEVSSSINMVTKTIDSHQIIKLCRDIHDFQNIGIFGLLKAGSAAINLQTDLLMQGKQTYTNISYKQQLQYITNASNEDLIIIFSYTGSYFNFQELRALKKRLIAPKIWMICSNIEEFPDYIDEIIQFDSKQNQGSNPYQLLFVSSIIAQEYYKLYNKD